MKQLAEMARGVGGGVSASGGGRKGKGKEKMDINMEEICGGKVDLKQDVSCST
jgi:ATP-dependent DNA helicase Q1